MGRLAVATIVSFWAIPISIIVNRIVPDPYMDELFHVPQAQQYCKGNFRSWDPMITTPPGLYYLSLSYVASLFPGMLFLQETSSFSNVCSTSLLRSTNVLLAVICSVIVYEIITLLRPSFDEGKATLCAVTLALFPLHWFFTFLYYTDIASLTFVLAMYLACLKKNYHFSALIGAFAVVIRQTNIIWMVFVACTGVLDVTLAHQINDKKEDDHDQSLSISRVLTSNKIRPISSTLRKRNFVNSTNTATSVNDSSMTSYSGLLDEIQTILVRSWHLKRELVVFFSPFFMVLVAFVAFIRWNGSIVLGAKEAHTVSPHVAQILYFSLFSTLATAPFHFSSSQAGRVFHLFSKNKCLTFLSLTVGFIIVHFFSIAHPYLLADNRHYPFYLWRKTIKAHWSIKYLLVPLYVYSWLSIVSALGKVQKRIWVLAYFLATAAVLVPAPLIEFRYFTIPFYLMALHLHINDYKTWVFIGTIYIAVNTFTVAMFLFRPFHWDHEPGVQRFIW